MEMFLVKAMREAKRNTSWVDPDVAHEREVVAAVRRLYRGGLEEDLGPFAARVAEAARQISLGMTLLKLTVPGVPDIYWGDELESLNLVDPDNRRPVDWERRALALGEMRRGVLVREETAKLAVIFRTLELRAARPDVFRGSYEPVAARVDVCRFRRGGEVEVAVPLSRASAKDGPSGWRDLLPELRVGLYVKS
jgi:(1->4)-alpha-D-glucan 1-alpha-D-glucosylmutase